MRNPHCIRHYTTCNAMIPAVYTEYVRALKGTGDFNPLVLDSKDSSTMAFTIKNYNQQKGLSWRFFESD